MTYDRNIRAYRETDLQTMSKEKLIVLLYRKMLEHLDAAAAAARGNRLEMARRLSLAQRIVSELRASLDHAIGGDVAANLDRIYDFVFDRILKMQVDRDPTHADECRRVLEPLLEAWAQIPSGSAERDAADGTDRASHPGTPAGAGTPPVRDDLAADREQRISISA
jgi:flagellar protein FliS